MPNRTRADLRLGAKWTLAQELKNLIIVCAVWVGLAAADRLPAGGLLAAGRGLGRLARALFGAARRAAVENATASLAPEDATVVARTCFERAGQNLAISLLLRRRHTRALDWVMMPESSRACLADALSRRRGAIFVCAHLGPFELVPAALAELGIAPTIVVRESYDPRLNDWVDAHRRARGAEVIHRGDKGAATAIVRALRAGRPVGLLPDLGGRVRSIPTTFLGSNVAFPIGPAHLARRLACPLVVGTLASRSRQGVGTVPFELRIQELDVNAPLAELTQRIAAALESEILRAPEEWLWMARRSLLEPGKAPGVERSLLQEIRVGSSAMVVG